jgi:transposase
MRFYTQKHKFYCGIDLHARTMYVCIVNQAGEILVHKNLPTEPEPFLKLIEPYREDIVVGVECVFLWYWLADLCADEDIPFILGHALYMKAIHKGKAKNDKIDSEKISRLIGSRMFPLAYVYPRKMRGDRDLLRRRCYFVNRRGELLTHIQNTNSQYNLPPIGRRLDREKNREGVGEHFPRPAVRKSVEADLKLLDYFDLVINDMEKYIDRRVKFHDAHSYYLLRSVDGIGPILASTILYEIEDIKRFPRVQNFSSYARLVKCSRGSAGKIYGFGGGKIGNVHLKWAFSEAAVLFLRANPRGQQYLARLEKKHGKGKALSIIAARLGRAVYFMLRRGEPFNREKFYAS